MVTHDKLYLLIETWQSKVIQNSIMVRFPGKHGKAAITGIFSHDYKLPDTAPVGANGSRCGIDRK